MASALGLSELNKDLVGGQLHPPSPSQCVSCVLSLQPSGEVGGRDRPHLRLTHKEETTLLGVNRLSQKRHSGWNGVPTCFQASSAGGSFRSAATEGQEAGRTR